MPAQCGDTFARKLRRFGMHDSGHGGEGCEVFAWFGTNAERLATMRLATRARGRAHSRGSSLDQIGFPPRRPSTPKPRLRHRESDEKSEG